MPATTSVKKSTKPKNAKLSKISLILPVYNEEENVMPQYEKIIKSLREVKNPHEIIFINDGSIDSSGELLTQLAKKDKNVKIIHFRRNFGQTAAMSAGIDYSSGEIVILMDSDLQNDPDDINMLISKIDEGYDVVSGWRKNRKDKMISRKIPSMIANKIISKVTGVNLHDLGCSLKAYRGEVIRQVNLYGEMHRFIPVHASWIGAKITEVPVKHHARQFGKSKYGLKRTIKVLLDLITVKFLGSYSTKPIYVFGGSGIILFLLSMVSGTAVIAMKLMYRHSMVRNPLLLLTIMLIILSMLFVHIGILAEMLVRIYHEAQTKPPYTIKEKLNFK